MNVVELSVDSEGFVRHPEIDGVEFNLGGGDCFRFASEQPEHIYLGRIILPTNRLNGVGDWAITDRRSVCLVYGGEIDGKEFETIDDGFAFAVEVMHDEVQRVEVSTSRSFLRKPRGDLASVWVNEDDALVLVPMSKHVNTLIEDIKDVLPPVRNLLKAIATSRDISIHFLRDKDDLVADIPIVREEEKPQLADTSEVEANDAVAEPLPDTEANDAVAEPLPETEANDADVSRQRPSVASVADEIGKLYELRNEGALTDSEFEAQKRVLLGSSADVSDTSAAPAASGAWRSDPYGRHQLRWWEGSAWSVHVSDGGVAGTDEVAL